MGHLFLAAFKIMSFLCLSIVWLRGVLLPVSELLQCVINFSRQILEVFSLYVFRYFFCSFFLLIPLILYIMHILYINWYTWENICCPTNLWGPLHLKKFFYLFVSRLDNLNYPIFKFAYSFICQLKPAWRISMILFFFNFSLEIFSIWWDCSHTFL